MMIGKMKSNLVLSICVKKFHCAREYVKDTDHWGSPSGSPATKAIRRQLRKKVFFYRDKAQRKIELV